MGISLTFVILLSLNIKTMAKIEEIWRDIPGHDGSHQVSNLGRVRNPSIIRKQQISTTGYWTVNLPVAGKCTIRKVHRLEAIAFLPNPEHKRCVNHKDGNRLNNHITNLEWATHKENAQHAFKYLPRIILKGQECPKAKLSEADVMNILSLHAKGFSQRGIVKAVTNVNISRRNVRSIIDGTSWKHLPRTV